MSCGEPGKISFVLSREAGVCVNLMQQKWDRRKMMMDV
jgi:hypothetical protein